MNPYLLKPYIKAHLLQKKAIDEQNWYLGQYIMNAVNVSLDHAFNGRKATSKYVEKPVMADLDLEPPRELTEEEKIEKTQLFFARLEAMKSNFELNN